MANPTPTPTGRVRRGRRHRRQPHPVRALEHRLHQRVQPGDAHRGPRRARRPLRPRRASVPASSSPAPCSSTAATSTWPARRCSARSCPPDTPPPTSSRPATPASRPRSRSPTRSRSARSSSASPAAPTPRRTPRWPSATSCARSCSRPTAAKDNKGRLAAIAKIRPGHLAPDQPRNAEPRTGLSMGDSQAITTKEWGITREAQDELAVDVAPEPRRVVRRGLAGRPGHAVPRRRARQQPARRLLDGEARQAQAGLRQGRGRHDDGGQLDAAVRRRLHRAARLRRGGRAARLDAAGVLRRLRDRRRRLRERRRGPADGSGLRRAADARAPGPHAAGLRLLRDPRGVRRPGAHHARGVGGPGVLQGEARPRRAARRRSTAASSTSRARRSPPRTRSRPPADASSPTSPSCCTRRARAAA